MNKFRYDINALRAIAVLSVLFFHLDIPFFSGGFAGVDIFFVISGYLMTKIIVDGYRNNTFSILDFYAKRAKRIIPALLFLVLIVTVAGYFIYLPNQYNDNEKNASASLLFLSNILYWRSTGYFASAAVNNVLLHTWSLSLEWQFYLIYPVLIGLVLKLNRNKQLLTRIFTVVIILLLITSIYSAHKSPVASFYLLPTRAWELLLGGLAVPIQGRIKSTSLLVLCYIEILFTIVLFNDSFLWPGGYTLVPVAGAFLIIVLKSDDHFLLKNNIVQFLGKTSYSLYLWHWPIIVFSRYLGFRLTAPVVLVILVLSIFMGYISYRFIESIKFKNTYPIFITGGCLALFTLFFSYSNANKWLFKPKTIEIADYPETHRADIDKSFSLNTCFIVDHDLKIDDFKKRSCLQIDSTKENILILGDSHAASLAASFRGRFAVNHINVLQANASQGFSFCDDFGTNKFSNDLNRYIYYDFLVKNRKYINGVILAGNWHTSSEDVIQPLLKVIAYLEKLGIPVVIIGQNNTFTIPFPSVAAKWNENHINNVDLYADKQTLYFNNVYKDLLKPYYVDVYYYANMPIINNDKVPFLSDADHLSTFGSDLVVTKIFNNQIFKTRILSKL